MTEPLIYEHPLSPYVQKVKIALLEKQVRFDLAGMQDPAHLATFLAQSPRAEVPLLIHGDVSIYDSSIILQYVEETWPEPPLLPGAPAERARVRMLEEAMDTHFEANTWGLGEVRVFGRGKGGAGDSLDRFACDEIAAWFRWLEGELTPRPWFNGSEFGWGDICVAPFVNGAARFDLHPEAGCALEDWIQRVNERASVAAATEDARAAELDPQTMQTAIASGFKREYRDHRLEWMVRAGGLQVVEDGIAADNLRLATPFQPQR